MPKSFLEQADEIVVADVPAEESLGHMGGGADEEHKLSRLREMTMLLAAEVVERQLQVYLHSHGIDEVSGTQERILVCITPRSNARQVLESGKRNADRFHGELFAVYVRQPGSRPKTRRRWIETSRSHARSAHRWKCWRVRIPWKG